MKEKVISIYNKIISGELMIDTVHMESLTFVLKQAIYFEHFELADMYSKEIDRRIKFNICDHYGITYYVEDSHSYCIECNKSMIWTKTGRGKGFWTIID